MVHPATRILLSQCSHAILLNSGLYDIHHLHHMMLANGPKVSSITATTAATATATNYTVTSNITANNERYCSTHSPSSSWAAICSRYTANTSSSLTARCSDCWVLLLLQPIVPGLPLLLLLVILLTLSDSRVAVYSLHKVSMWPLMALRSVTDDPRNA